MFQTQPSISRSLLSASSASPSCTSPSPSTGDPSSKASNRAFVDFQAVIIAGPGHQLHPLVDSHHSPKCLLPVANKPLIVHVLNWLGDAGVSNCMVLANPKLLATLKTIVFKNCKQIENVTVIPFIEEEVLSGASSASNVIMDDFHLQSNHDDSLGFLASRKGTMAALWAAREYIKSDFILLPCDLCTDAPLAAMADLHRSVNALVTCLLHNPAMGKEGGGSVGGQAQGKEPPPEESLRRFTEDQPVQYIGMQRSLVCYQREEASSDRQFSIPMSLLKKHPHIHMRSDLMDAHCYMFSKDVFEHPVMQSPRMGKAFFSVREELLPALVKTGGVHGFIFDVNTQIDRAATAVGTAAAAATTTTTGSGEGKASKPGQKSSHYCLRANNPGALITANRIMQFQGRPARTPHPGKPPTNLVSPSSQTDQLKVVQGERQAQPVVDSLVGEGGSIGERSSIRRSTIGNHVTIGKSVKITNCLIMDHVVIQDHCKLDSVIAAAKSTIRDVCTMKDCVIGPEYVVERETEATGEAFYIHD